MVVTEPTFQPEMSSLKEVAKKNIPNMFVTDEVSQDPIGSLNVVLPENRIIILVIPEVHQVPISPNAAKSLGPLSSYVASPSM